MSADRRDTPSAPYREPDTADIYIEPVPLLKREIKMPSLELPTVPYWASHTAVIAAACVGVGGTVDACNRWGHQGLCGGVISALCIVAIVASIRLLEKASA